MECDNLPWRCGHLVAGEPLCGRRRPSSGLLLRIIILDPPTFCCGSVCTFAPHLDCSDYRDCYHLVQIEQKSNGRAYRESGGFKNDILSHSWFYLKRELSTGSLCSTDEARD